MLKMMVYMFLNKCLLNNNCTYLGLTLRQQRSAVSSGDIKAVEVVSSVWSRANVTRWNVWSLRCDHQAGLCWAGEVEMSYRTNTGGSTLLPRRQPALPSKHTRANTR